MTDRIDLGAALRDALPTHTAPASLHAWARERAAAEDMKTRSRTSGDARGRWTSLSRMSLYAAGLLVASIVGWSASDSYQQHQQSGVTQDALVVELVDTHVRSLAGDHLMDVRSTDNHTVKPWFAGKIDFAPPVLDLATRGFPLLGGRVEYIQGRSSAAVVYGRRRHFVNLFMWPAVASDKSQASRRYRGYSMLHWVADGVSYWAVTDAAPADLEVLRQAYEAGT